MFALKSLFNRDKKRNQQLVDSLERYRSMAFPVGLSQCATISVSQWQKDGLTLTLETEFAASGETAAIREFLSKQLACAINLTLVCRIQTAPRFAAIKHIILVASGKGGVGKSTTAVNIAAALQLEGAQVGILDADIYGPSIPMLMGLDGAQPQAKDEKTLLPFVAHGIKTQSIGFLVPNEQAMVWRGPMASQALNQLLSETDWGELDYLVVDMPPGTGDIQLTMSQKVPASGALIVTTPQDLALADAQKGIAMFEKVKVPIIGMIENMSAFVCGHCGQTSHVFGHDGGKELAHRYGVPLLAQIPLQLAIREASEEGKSISFEKNSVISQQYAEAARLMASQLYYQDATQSQLEIIITDD